MIRERSSIKSIVLNEPSVNYSGYFIELMTSFNRFISEEYKQNRLTGAQYAQVYLAGMQANLAAAIDFAKHEDAMDIQADKLELEREMNETQKALVRAQTQAFKAKHNKELAKLIFDVVTVGVTQEQMNILAGPNPVFEGLKPKDEYTKALWVDDVVIIP